MCKRKFILSVCCAVLLPALFSGCASSKKEKDAPKGKFMGNDKARTKQDFTFNDMVDDIRKKKREERERFRDVSRPMKQDSYQVFPWKKSGRNRSEELHDAKGSLFY